jgi:hypothetical protein
MQHSTGSTFTGEYLGEFETEFNNILGCQSGLEPRGNRLTKKTEGRKSCDTVPLSLATCTIQQQEAFNEIC